MFGGGPSRNMVNTFEKNLPADWSVEEFRHKNIKWQANLGGQSLGSPVVADGRVFVGTGNTPPRNPSIKKPRAALMAFREEDGKFLWQNLHDFHGEPFHVSDGLLSTPTVEGGRVFYVTPRCDVICANTADGVILWGYSMMKELHVVPHYGRMCRNYGNCSPLVVDDLLLVVTANGIDDDGNASPKAPSFIALNKNTGKLIWQSNLPGENIREAQSSNAVLANVNGARQVIFGGGDGVIYSFDPPTGKLLWKCDCLPKRQKKGAPTVDNYIVATPVVVGDKLYIGLGTHPECGRPRGSYFLCLDITKKGDVSLKSYVAKAAENKDSALVWAFGGPVHPQPKKGRSVHFGSTMSTAAVHDGLVYITEENGYAYCLDAATGRRYWEHDLKSSVWSSPYWVDGRVFVCSEDGDVVILAHGRDLKVLATIEMDEFVRSTPVAANGTLYVATRSKLYAISSR